MSHNVIDLATRRGVARQPATACCARHRLDALADAIERRLDETNGSLLIPVVMLEESLTDLRAVIEELLPTRQTRP